MTGEVEPATFAGGDPIGWQCTVPVPEGYRVGPWEVTRPVASGAWATVYAARRRSGPGHGPGGGTLDRPEPDEAALKFLPAAVQTPRLSALLQELARRERARYVALCHERLVRTLDVLTVCDPAMAQLDGSAVVVMELAAGSLADLLTVGGGAPLGEAGRCLAEIAEGLGRMHAAGWVHGDLKPGNVLVRPDGGCCLADFGLSGVLDGTHAYVPPLASPDFAPPERCDAVATTEGQQVRTSDDIWAFGVIACLALTGRMPLPGLTPWARAEAASEYAAGLRALTLPDGLVAPWRCLVTDCLHPDPGRRPTAQEVIRRVRAARRGAHSGTCPGSATRATRPRRGEERPGLRTPRQVAFLAASGAAVVLGSSAWLLRVGIRKGRKGPSPSAAAGSARCRRRGEHLPWRR